MEAINKRRALGRGLGALIPATYATDEGGPDTLVPLSSIYRNPMQPRRVFAEDALDELAESIRQKGILQPLLVRPANGGYELIAGERRLRAAQRAGVERVPVLVRDTDAREMLELALIENIQREDLNPLEEARAYRRLLDDFDLTQDEVATRVGKDRSTIANCLRLLQLPAEVQAEIERGTLSAGHARALAGASEAASQIDLTREVITQHLTVRQTERLVQQRQRAQPGPEVHAVEQRLTEALGTRVRLTPKRNGAGKIEIEYYSLDELNGLVDRLAGAVP